ncbi:MAG: hypothetical protein SGPRY_001064 [Prymnesium sp.]
MLPGYVLHKITSSGGSANEFAMLEASDYNPKLAAVALGSYVTGSNNFHHKAAVVMVTGKTKEWIPDIEMDKCLKRYSTGVTNVCLPYQHPAFGGTRSLKQAEADCIRQLSFMDMCKLDASVREDDTFHVAARSIHSPVDLWHVAKENSSFWGGGEGGIVVSNIRTPRPSAIQERYLPLLQRAAPTGIKKMSTLNGIAITSKSRASMLSGCGVR